MADTIADKLARSECGKAQSEAQQGLCTILEPSHYPASPMNVSGLIGRINQPNAFKGIISDAALAEMHRVAGEDIKRIGRVIIADLDVADGKADGRIEKATLVRKADKLAALIGVEPELMRQQVKTVPEQGLSTDALNASVAEAVGRVLSKPVVASSTPENTSKLPHKLFQLKSIAELEAMRHREPAVQQGLPKVDKTKEEQKLR